MTVPSFDTMWSARFLFHADRETCVIKFKMKCITVDFLRLQQKTSVVFCFRLFFHLVDQRSWTKHRLAQSKAIFFISFLSFVTFLSLGFSLDSCRLFLNCQISCDNSDVTWSTWSKFQIPNARWNADYFFFVYHFNQITVQQSIFNTFHSLEWNRFSFVIKSMQSRWNKERKWRSIWFFVQRSIIWNDSINDLPPVHVLCI